MTKGNPECSNKLSIYNAYSISNSLKGGYCMGESRVSARPPL